MDPGGEDDWLGSCKAQPPVKLGHDGNVARSWQWRELGLNLPHGASNRTLLEHAAEDNLVHKDPFNLKCCDLPGYPRSTFLMVFSPDGTTVASTHGNHNIYLTELASGKNVGILKGHPRTPWCIAFHPSHAQLVGSGCLGGQVRVWDLSGSSEVWTVASETVIASIAFHPRDQLLVVATYNELYFWDWSQRAPFTKVSTNNVNEKVRYVAFDALGHKLITGISVWSSGGGCAIHGATTHGEGPNANASPPDPPFDNPESPRGDNNEDLIVTSYHNLVQRYDSLVRNYHRLFLSRSNANTTDRGTDPMDVDVSNNLTTTRQRPTRSTVASDAAEINDPLPRRFSANYSTSEDQTNTPVRSQDPAVETNSTSSADTTPSTSQEWTDWTRMFGSRQSAFQPLNDNSGERSHPYNLLNVSRLHQVLPNPYSSLPQADLPQRPEDSTASRTRTFSREGNDTDELSNAFSEAFVTMQQRRNSSSRTRAFTSPRNNDTGDGSIDANDLTRRTLSFERLLQLRGIPQRDPDDLSSRVGEDLRRRALDRLLDLEAADNGAERPVTENLQQNVTEPRSNPWFMRYTNPERNSQSSASIPTAFDPSRLRDIIASQIASNPGIIDGQPEPTGESSTAMPDSRNTSSGGNPTATATSGSSGGTTPSAPTISQAQNETPLSISQSLDMIRDILRDSGARLLNIITDMSYTTLASVDAIRRLRERSDRTPTEELYTVTSNESLRRRLANTSSSETDSDHSLEVNIYRTRNTSFPEGHRNTDHSNNNNPDNERVPRPTSRMVVNLDLTEPSETPEQSSYTLNNNRINITVSNNRFRLRTNNVDENSQSVENQTQGDTTASQNPTTAASESTFNADRSITLSFPIPGSSVTQTLSFPASAPTSNSPAAVTTSTSLDPSALSVSSVIQPGQSSSSPDNTTSNCPSDQRSNENTDPQLPSTSRDTAWLYSRPSSLSEQRAQDPLIAADALRKVKLGVEALQRHTSTLTDMWLRGTRTTMRELRVMWEDLRRQIVILHRQTGRTESSVYFARSLLERCHMLTDLSRRALNRTMESFGRGGLNRPDAGSTTEAAVQVNVPTGSASPGTNTSTNRAGWADTVEGSSSNAQDNDQPSTSRNTTDNIPGANPRSNQSWSRQKRYITTARKIYQTRTDPIVRRRLQATAEHFQRRQRTAQRIEQYLLNARSRSRRENSRSIELHFTRHEIRVRAMQVLSMMFNVMMACLEEGELSSHIMVMLRTLKRALGVTCLLLMTSARRREPANTQSFRRRNSTGPYIDQTANQETTPNAGESTAPSSDIPPSTSGDSQVDPSAVDSVPTNPTSNNGAPVDTTDNTVPVDTTSDIFTATRTVAAGCCSNCSVPLQVDTSNDVNMQNSADINTTTDETKVNEQASTSAKSDENTPQVSSASRGNKTTTADDSEQQSTSYRWSNRLAIQISAANKNQSETAKRRRQIYLERKRLKALHRSNPIAHPLTKRKAQPLITHRIPTPRQLPRKERSSSVNQSRITINTSNEPVAGPSNPQPSTSANDASNSASRIRQEHRAGLIRFAQFHAARLRNATRNRFRIRLYTPSSVREMIDILTTSPNEREPEVQQPLNNAPESQPRRPISTYRPHLLTVRNNLESLNPGPEGSRPFGSLLNNVSVPLVQVNNMPVNEAPGPPNPPRVSEYLQPIILAQSAGFPQALEEAVGGGLLETGFISESLLVQVHRVQAWDFTKGEAPDIKDGTKNVVVKRCKIHNDASIDISRDGRLLVALLPVHRMRNMSHRLGVYSLEWSRLGECLHTVVLEQSAVSVALSPTARHLAVGLGSRRVTTLPHNRNNVFALLFKLADEGPVNENSRQCGLIQMRILDHSWEHGFTSLNCLRWAPAPGQGLLYANNTGQLIILS